MSSLQLLHLFVFGIVLIIFASRFPRFAIRTPVAYSMLIALIVLIGGSSLLRLPVELMPDIAYGNVTVFIDVRGGMPPPDVERLVTKPVEEAMATVSKMKNILSTSKKHRSVVTLEFEPGTNMSLATMEVREKFLRVKSKLPKEIERPIIAHYEEADAPVVIAALTSDWQTPEELRRYVEERLKEKLLRIDGVANVEIGGGRERKIIVDIDRNKLIAHGIPVKKIVSILEQNNLNMQVGEIAGSMSTFALRALGTYRSVAEIENTGIALSTKGGMVRLKDIAEIRDSFLEAESYSRLNSKSAVTLYIQKESMTNTVKVASRVMETLDEFKAGLDPNTHLLIVSDQSTAILSAIHSVEMTMVFGAVLVVLILSLFLSKTLLTRTLTGTVFGLLLAVLVAFYVLNIPLDASRWIVAGALAIVVVAALAGQKDIYPSFIVALSIPVTLFITLAFMYFEHFTLNVITLSGLVLGIGLLVDNSIVVLENFDRIRHTARDLPAGEQVEKAAAEVVAPMVGGTLTTVVVFLPFFLLQKQTQILFAGIAFAVMTSLLASLFAALSLVPALAARLRIEDAAKGWKAGEEWIKMLLSGMRRPRDAKTKPRDEGRNDKDTSVSSLVPESEANDCPSSLEVSSLVPRPSSLGRFAARIAHGYRAFIPVAIVLLALGWLAHAVFGINADLWAYLACVVFVLAAGLFMFREYAGALSWCLAHRRFVLGVIGLLFVSSLYVFSYRLPKDFMTSSEQNEFVIFVECASGVRLDISDKIVKEVEKRIQEMPAMKGLIKSISSRVEGWSSKVYVTLVPRSERRQSTQQVIDGLRDKFKNIGEEYDTFIYFSEPRSGKEIFVEVFGYSYETLSKLAMRLATEMGKVPGFSDVKVRYRPGQPEATVRLDHGSVAYFGFDNKEIAETMHAQMRGLRATSFFDKAEEVETIVRVSPSQVKTIEQLKLLPFITSQGYQVPSEHLSRLVFGLAPSEIWHRNKARMIQVSANLGSMPLGEAAELTKAIFKKIPFPDEYYADIGGDYDEMVEANRSFMFAMAMTIVLVFAVLACLFESFSQPFIIMMTVLLSSIGAVAALTFSGSTVTLGVSIGMLMLCGIVVNNGIMLIDRVNLLKKTKDEGRGTGDAETTSKGEKDIKAIIIEAASQRKRPIFMTTTTTVLGLLPMALDRSESAVLWSPLAITVIGGLLTSTILTLFVVPCFYLAFSGMQRWAGEKARSLSGKAVQRFRMKRPARG